MQGHVCNSSSGEAEATRLLQIQDQPGSQWFIGQPWINNNTNSNNKKLLKN